VVFFFLQPKQVVALCGACHLSAETPKTGT